MKRILKEHWFSGFIFTLGMLWFFAMYGAFEKGKADEMADINAANFFKQSKSQAYEFSVLADYNIDTTLRDMCPGTREFHSLGTHMVLLEKDQTNSYCHDSDDGYGTWDASETWCVYWAKNTKPFACYCSLKRFRNVWLEANDEIQALRRK